MHTNLDQNLIDEEEEDFLKDFELPEDHEEGLDLVPKDLKIEVETDNKMEEDDQEDKDNNKDNNHNAEKNEKVEKKT